MVKRSLVFVVWFVLVFAVGILGGVNDSGCGSEEANPEQVWDVCGNGVVEDTNGEECDDGNADNSDGCPDDITSGGTCQEAFCGDGFVWQGHEECDDGNTQSGDGCSENCEREVCGDGVVTQPAENCDDGNTQSGDGCSEHCRIEVGWGCGGQPSHCQEAGIEWVDISGGRFQMGSGLADASPVHEVIVPSFKMSRSEITFGQYKKCVDEGVCMEPSYVFDGNWSDADKADRPAFGVNWTQARVYCEWVGGMLPSESQWEYAARSQGKDVAFPWGVDPADCDHVVAEGCSQTGSAEDVCSRPLGNTEQGLCDMAGNVAEWVEDLYWYNYVGAPTDGSAREEVPRLDSRDRVVRGGDYTSRMSEVLRDLETRTRSSQDPSSQASTIGFRCVR